jgi:AcrR family transcriptional regulator
MSGRNYSLGRRQEGVDRTRKAILAAARDLLVSGDPREMSADVSAGAVARRAGISRITIYNQFGSKAGLLSALATGAMGERPIPADLQPAGQLRRRIDDSCSRWSTDPALFRRLFKGSNLDPDGANEDRALAERLAASDLLRAGCSLKEAEDVIGVLTSFPVFDRLHKNGRRSPAAVAEILMSLAAAILA